MDFDSEALEKEIALDSDNDTDPPLAHRAAASGDVPILVQSIKQDPGLLEQRDSEGFTPLAYAVQSQQLHAVKRLVKMGADIDSQDASGRTSLSVAAYQGWNEGVVYLLRKGANQTISDKSGRTPLHASTYDSDPKTLLSLLQRLSYSEINQTDHERMTALHWAAFHDRPEHLRLLLQRGAQTLIQDIDGKTPLHWAAQNGCRSCCVLLAEHDPDSELVHCTDNSGKTALHLAAAAGHHFILQDLARFLQDLYESEDQDDRTPLHWAAAMGHVECIKTLLKLGVTPNPIDIDGGSPLEYAKQAGHTQCCEILEERLGLRKFNSDNDKNKHGLSTKIGKSNKGAVGFFKGLFSRKEKQVGSEITTFKSKLELPALNVSGRTEISSDTYGAYDSGQSINTQRRKRSVSNHVADTCSKTDSFVHDSVSKGLSNLTIDGQTFDDNINQNIHKPRKHKRKKKHRHKLDREDRSLATTNTTDSSLTDDNINSHIQSNTTSLKSMHLSPLVGTVRPASISPRVSNANETTGLTHSNLSSKRLGELNPLRKGRPLNGIYDVPLSNALATLRQDQDGSSRSPTPPPPLPSLNTKKALPDISPLAYGDENEYNEKRRLRKKYRDVTGEDTIENDLFS